MWNSSIWAIEKTLSCTITPGQNKTGRNGNEQVLCISQSSSITGTLPSDCLRSYLGHMLGGLITLQRCSRCILHPQQTGLYCCFSTLSRQISRIVQMYHLKDSGDKLKGISVIIGWAKLFYYQTLPRGNFRYITIPK